jgi:hypothetical protein
VPGQDQARHPAGPVRVAAESRGWLVPERIGQWDLLDRPSDPIVADTGQIDERVAHYRQIADEMRAAPVRVDRFGDGAASQSQYADKLRCTTKEVARTCTEGDPLDRRIRSLLTCFVPGGIES